MAAAQNREKSSGAPNPAAPKKDFYDRRIANLKPFKPGQSGNPKGRRKGQRDYRTIYWIAVQRMAELHGMSPEQIEEHLQFAAIEKAMKGDFFFYQEISNRIHGKPTDKMDLTSGGKSIADLITIANAKPQPGAKPPAKVQG